MSAELLRKSRAARIRRIPAGYLTTAQTAEALGVSRATFDRRWPRYRDLGLLEAPRFGNSPRLFLASSVTRVLQGTGRRRLERIAS